MSIQFNPQDKDFNTPSYEPVERSSKMVAWVVKLSGGMISESQANYVLLGLAAVFFVITIAVIVNMNSSSSEITTSTPNQQQTIQQRFIDRNINDNQ